MFFNTTSASMTSSLHSVTEQSTALLYISTILRLACPPLKVTVKLLLSPTGHMPTSLLKKMSHIMP